MVFEQFLLDASFFNNRRTRRSPTRCSTTEISPPFGKRLGVQFAQNVDTPAALDGALAAAKVFNAPTLIAAQVDVHGLPAKLTGAALAGGGPLR
jgi:hypothetical protein